MGGNQSTLLFVDEPVFKDNLKFIVNKNTKEFLDETKIPIPEHVGLVVADDVSIHNDNESHADLSKHKLEVNLDSELVADLVIHFLDLRNHSTPRELSSRLANLHNEKQIAIRRQMDNLENQLSVEFEVAIQDLIEAVSALCTGSVLNSVLGFLKNVKKGGLKYLRKQQKKKVFEFGLLGINNNVANIFLFSFQFLEITQEASCAWFRGSRARVNHEHVFITFHYPMNRLEKQIEKLLKSDPNDLSDHEQTLISWITKENTPITRKIIFNRPSTEKFEDREKAKDEEKPKKQKKGRKGEQGSESND